VLRGDGADMFTGNRIHHEAKVLHRSSLPSAHRPKRIFFSY